MPTNFILHTAKISLVYRPQTMSRKQAVKSKSSSKQNKRIFSWQPHPEKKIPKIGFEQINNSFEASDPDVAPSDDFDLIGSLKPVAYFQIFLGGP